MDAGNIQKAILVQCSASSFVPIAYTSKLIGRCVYVVSVIGDNSGVVVHYRCCVVDRRSLMLVSALVGTLELSRARDRSGAAKILRSSAWRVPWMLTFAIGVEELQNADAASRIALRA